MSDFLSEDGTFINSLIGAGTSVKGDIALKGLLRIDGDFSGTIKMGGKVLIGRSGRAEASIEAGTVVIGGVLKGNVVATEKVVVLSTGMMIGNINSPRLLVEDGVIIDGRCSVTGSSGTEQSGSLSSLRFSSESKEAKMESVSHWTE